jgi:hypothetical protein
MVNVQTTYPHIWQAMQYWAGDGAMCMPCPATYVLPTGHNWQAVNAHLATLNETAFVALVSGENWQATPTHKALDSIAVQQGMAFSN